MFYLKCFLILILIWIRVGNGMAANVCDQIDSGNYKTVRLSNGNIQLISGENSYTFSEGNIKNAKIDSISKLSPNDLSPITECFANNGKIYYIRQNKAIVYDGQSVSSFTWNPTSTNISRLIIARNGKTTGFLVPPTSQNTGSGESMSSTNDVSVMAYGSGSSVSISSVNGNMQIVYNGWSVPNQFNAFLANTDNSLTFFNGNKYCVAKHNSESQCLWNDVNKYFGCN